MRNKTDDELNDDTNTAYNVSGNEKENGLTHIFPS